MRSLQDRFNEKVDKSTPDGHWLWTASLTANGYGKLGTGGHTGGWALAHRISWELHRGPIPDGLTIDHLCRVRHCVNPDHLEPVSLKVNLLRGESPPALLAAKTHCKYGHAFTPENTFITTRGYRQCITCRRLRDRARWPQRRERENTRRAERLRRSANR